MSRLSTNHEPQNHFMKTKFRYLVTLALLVVGAAPATAQTLLFEDDFNDGVIDTNLWEVFLPLASSSIAEAGGVLRIGHRGWLLSAESMDGLDQDLMIEGEFSPQSSNDSWRTLMYANKAPNGDPHWENTDHLSGTWYGYCCGDPVSVGGSGNIQSPGASGASVGGAWKGFRLITFNGMATWELWDLANPADTVILQTAYSKLPGAGERIIFYNREYSALTLLDNVRVYSGLDCDLNGVLDSTDIASDPGLDCDSNGILDTCDIASDPGLDFDQNGVLDSCECVTSNYCLAAGNSAGTSAIISSQGTLSISTNDFALAVTGAPPLKPGIFFYGANQTQVFLGEGLLCIAPDIQRLQPVVLTDAQGGVVMPIDFTAPPFDAGAFGVTLLSTWNFQFWYRDPLGGPAGFNFSDGLEVTFCP